MRMPETKNTPDPVQVFISYRHDRRDIKLKTQLCTSLASLKRQQLIAEWTDQAIQPGEEWIPAIQQALEQSELLLALISPDYMASDFCVDEELLKAIAASRNDACIVIPILLRPTHRWQDVAGKFQALPTDPDTGQLKPITDWGNRDRAFLHIVSGIERTVKSIIERRPKKSG